MGFGFFMCSSFSSCYKRDSASNSFRGTPCEADSIEVFINQSRSSRVLVLSDVGNWWKYSRATAPIQCSPTDSHDDWYLIVVGFDLGDLSRPLARKQGKSKAID